MKKILTIFEMPVTYNYFYSSVPIFNLNDDYYTSKY